MADSAALFGPAVVVCPDDVGPASVVETVAAFG